MATWDYAHRAASLLLPLLLNTGLHLAECASTRYGRRTVCYS